MKFSKKASFVFYLSLSDLNFSVIAVLDTAILCIEYRFPCCGTGMTDGQFFSFKKTSKVLDESPGGVMNVAEFLSGIHFKE